MQATHVRNVDSWRSDARLYRLSEPVPYDDSEDVGHIVVSAVIAMDTGEAETFIFPAREDGKVISYGEMPGSFRGDLDHERAIEAFIEHYSRETA